LQKYNDGRLPHHGPDGVHVLHDDVSLLVDGLEEGDVLSLNGDGVGEGCSSPRGRPVAGPCPGRTPSARRWT
jgi:hypothetical protein